MKIKILLGFYLISSSIFAQTATTNLAYSNSLEEISNKIKIRMAASPVRIADSGYNFEVLDAGVNSKYSEFCTGFFRNKVIMVSSKKLGPFAKIDPHTGEGYQDLYCLDVNKNGRLSKPILFSRILNSRYNESQLSFSPDQKTVYFTRSTQINSARYKLYKAVLEEGSHGNWTNIELLSINSKYASIENPYINEAGDKLYFSSNMAGSFGGYDIYVCNIEANGDLSEPINLGNKINTPKDEKYPSLSKDSKYLYFSSKGHLNFGGYDIFESRILKNGFSEPKNMGKTINTRFDEVAFRLAAKNKGYLSSNRRNNNGSYDIYTAINDEVTQTIRGKIIDASSRVVLANALIILKDEEGTELSRHKTGLDASYNFKVKPFDSYTISVSKEGFDKINFDFFANKGVKTTYFKNFELTTESNLRDFDTERELKLLAKNIFFDSNKSNIKKEVRRTLNEIIYVLNEHPEMKLSIEAHTDNIGQNSFNLGLSNDRAESVLNYLITNGISQGRLRFKGYGETKPVIDCKNNCTEIELQTNRRVELVIINK